jgi:hypothetical protein
MVSYSQREHCFEKGEHEWCVLPDVLVRREASGQEMRRPWRDTKTVRLGFRPTRYKPDRHVLEISFADGTRWRIDNCHFAGIADFEDRSATYLPFVSAALARIAEQAPGVAAYCGNPPWSYYIQVSIAAIGLLLCGAVLLALPVLDTWPGIVLVKLVLMAAMLPALFRWARRAYPRSMRIDDVPPEALPSLPPSEAAKGGRAD